MACERRSVELGAELGQNALEWGLVGGWGGLLVLLSAEHEGT